MAGERVLVVDDNALNLKLARVVLAAEGFLVATAGDAIEARSLLASFQPQLVLMDIQLPGMDGLALTRELKSDPASQNITVVALTSYAMRGDNEKALAAGCEGYLTKPIDTRSFGASVTTFLSRGNRTS